MTWFAPVSLTLQLASATALILLLVGTPLAWWLAHTRNRLKIPLAAILSLPLVLPPTVLGFYLLVAMGPDGWLGRLTDALGLQPMAFSFSGLLLGSLIYSLPFVVQPIQNAFEAIGQRPFEVAATLRAGPLDRFFSVALPLIRRDLISAGIMGFAHTVGEFGIILMIGGNIPGRTQVVSIALYNHVEALEYQQAHQLSLALLAFSFIVLCLLHALKRTSRNAQK
jgi:molybdate transport system permease protein